MSNTLVEKLEVVTKETGNEVKFSKAEGLPHRVIVPLVKTLDEWMPK